PSAHHVRTGSRGPSASPGLVPGAADGRRRHHVPGGPGGALRESAIPQRADLYGAPGAQAGVILSCLTAPFRLLGLLVLVGIGYVAWTMRDDLRHWVHRVTADPPPPPAVGLTLEQVQATAMARLDSLRRRRADSVVLSQIGRASCRERV